jgi:hypothetical protein
LIQCFGHCIEIQVSEESKTTLAHSMIKVYNIIIKYQLHILCVIKIDVEFTRSHLKHNSKLKPPCGGQTFEKFDKQNMDKIGRLSIYKTIEFLLSFLKKAYCL